MTTKVTCELVLTYLMGQYREDRAEVFQVVLSNGTGGNRQKLQQGKSQMGIRFFFFPPCR